MINIYIVPVVREIYKSQIEYCYDKKLLSFLKFAFKKYSLNFKLNKKLDLIIISGGNDLANLKKNPANFEKDRLSQQAFHYSKRNGIPIVGICGGAQFIAKKNNFIITKTFKHVGFHKIFWQKTKLYRTDRCPKIINSYHKYKISGIKKNFTVLAFAKDKSIESFVNYKKKILGVMWHPERDKKFKIFNREIINSIL
tara:strand:- start:3 stop:593 length:591 start_codon:yes stop_codon:yes gene_type:complete